MIDRDCLVLKAVKQVRHHKPFLKRDLPFSGLPAKRPYLRVVDQKARSSIPPFGATQVS